MSKKITKTRRETTNNAMQRNSNSDSKMDDEFHRQHPSVYIYIYSWIN